MGDASRTAPDAPEIDSAGVYLDLSLEDLNYGNLRRHGADAADADRPARRQDPRDQGTSD